MEGKRQYLLDGLRGLTLISMILYHGMFDLLDEVANDVYDAGI